ncbi:hypothetical protein CASFOL_005738 [Castilleja foliolosa]|uniref:Actin-fragmin kinase catalytic domain-containing protein n=1 Tax=Castilleja foliolosa TaxID=1961234 RepID=A0ABD3E4B2_9LAMI
MRGGDGSLHRGGRGQLTMGLRLWWFMEASIGRRGGADDWVRRRGLTTRRVGFSPVVASYHSDPLAATAHGWRIEVGMRWSLAACVPRNSISQQIKCIPHLGFAPLSQWNGLKQMGISISQYPVKIEKKGKCKGKGVYASLFGVGAPEILVIGVVSLLVFGPKGLAEMLLEEHNTGLKISPPGQSTEFSLWERLGKADMLDIESSSFSWNTLSSLHHTEHSSSTDQSEDEMNKSLESQPDNDESSPKEAAAVIKFSSSRMATQSERFGYEFAKWLGGCRDGFVAVGASYEDR